MNSPKKKSFKINELCWVKITGYPWWPAVVTGKSRSNKKPSYRVNYICERSNSFVDSENIRKWEENYGAFKDLQKTCKISLNLKCAVKIAELLYDGLIDLNDHEKYLEKYKISKQWHKLENVTTFFNEIINSKKSSNINKQGKKQISKNHQDNRKISNNNASSKGKKRNSKIKPKKMNKIGDNKDENNVIVISDDPQSEKNSPNNENNNENINKNKLNKNDEKKNNQINNFKHNLNINEIKDKNKSNTIKKNFLGKKKKRLFVFSATKEGEIKLEGIEKKTELNNNINNKDNTNKNNDNNLLTNNITSNLNEIDSTKKLLTNEEDQKLNAQSDIIKYEKSLCEVFGAPPGVSTTIPKIQ